LDDALRDYEYYEETTTIKPVAEVSSDAVMNPVTTLVNETNRLMLDLNSKYLEVADQVKKNIKILWNVLIQEKERIINNFSLFKARKCLHNLHII
jgi:hypothetical protein